MAGFGDSSVDLELCFWINDPQAGTTNVRSAVLLGIWDRFRERGIEIPFPQRHLHIRTLAELRVLTTPAPADGRLRMRAPAAADS
jgi:small-conductance mechanosensitive channel